MKFQNRPLFIAALLCVAMFTPLSSSMASDHLDAPSLSGNGQQDLADLFAFQGADSDNSVLIMTVNPFAGSASPTTFGTNTNYQFQVDNNGDSIADLTYEAIFTNSGGGQTYNLTRNGTSIASGSTGTSIATSNGGTVHAGVFDDPFFFDLNGFNDGFNFTGDDTFAGSNVNAIIFELPSTDFGNTDIGVWARTLQGGSQVDRVGRPAINTALIGSDALKEAFNLGSPENDFATFGDEVNANIAALSDQANADALTPILLPDILTFDTTDAGGFLNGRRLEDDVIDASLNLLSAGAVTGDGVDFNDVGFSSVFPYLAPAAVPEPTGLLPIALIFGAYVGRRRRS